MGSHLPLSRKTRSLAAFATRKATSNIATSRGSRRHSEKREARCLRVAVLPLWPSATIYMAWPQTIRVCNRSGLYFVAIRFIKESGGLAINPPRDKPSEDYKILRRIPPQGILEGSRHRNVIEWRGGT